MVKLSKVISGRQFPQEVIPLIERAKNSIRIIVFDWRWYPSDPGSSCQLFNQAILRAVRRGVKVQGIANCDEVISFLNREGCFIKRLRTTRLVHCKLMIIDGKVVVTGSHNYTQSAFEMNLELSVILESDEEQVPFVSFFNNLYN
jgi:phosphatidylserine/phosphatidylglycerophosphate/cardiolipin synthase-like enzyme